LNRREAIRGLGRSPKGIVLVQRPPAKQACPAKLGTIELGAVLRARAEMRDGPTTLRRDLLGKVERRLDECLGE